MSMPTAMTKAAEYSSFSGCSWALKVATNPSTARATTSTTIKRERKRRTLVGPLIWASRTTSSSITVWEICRATTPEARMPSASTTCSVASGSRPAAITAQALVTAIQIRHNAARPNSRAISEWVRV